MSPSGYPECQLTHIDVLYRAIEAAALSPCQSKRGVVIWDDYGIVSTGFNNQPKPFICDGSDKCKKSCSRTAVHAEQAALLNGDRQRIRGAQMLHIKVLDGFPMHGGGPSCLACSKLILMAGIRYMWLLHDAGWKRYETAEFNYQSSTGTDHLVIAGAGRPLP